MNGNIYWVSIDSIITGWSIWKQNEENPNKAHIGDTFTFMEMDELN